MSPARATSRVLAIVGDPVQHSLSPAMYNAAIAALGLDAVVGFRRSAMPPEGEGDGV